MQRTVLLGTRISSFSTRRASGVQSPCALCWYSHHKTVASPKIFWKPGQQSLWPHKCTICHWWWRANKLTEFQTVGVSPSGPQSGGSCCQSWLSCHLILESKLSLFWMEGMAGQGMFLWEIQCLWRNAVLLWKVCFPQVPVCILTQHCLQSEKVHILETDEKMLCLFKVYLNTWMNLAMRRSGRFIMKGRQSVARPVRSITELMNISFLRDVLRYLVKMWLVMRLPIRKPRKPRVHTKLMVWVSVCRL